MIFGPPQIIQVGDKLVEHLDKRRAKRERAEAEKRRAEAVERRIKRERRRDELRVQNGKPPLTLQEQRDRERDRRQRRLQREQARPVVQRRLSHDSDLAQQLAALQLDQDDAHKMRMQDRAQTSRALTGQM